MKIFVVTALIVLFSTTSNAQIYKWVDENGKTQYTDQRPPPGASRVEQRLNIKPTNRTNNTSEKSTNLVDERAEFNKRQQQKKEEETKQQAITEDNKRKCIDAQTRLRMYTDSPRLTVPDGSGGIVYVDDETRQQRINEANKAISEFCKKN